MKNKGYMIKSIYVQDKYFEVWDKFEKINKKNCESKSLVINELIKKYVEEEESKGVKTYD